MFSLGYPAYKANFDINDYIIRFLLQKVNKCQSLFKNSITMIISRLTNFTNTLSLNPVLVLFLRDFLLKLRIMDKKKIVEPKEHHKQLKLCTSRPPYRQGRKLTAVKVYTISDESHHILIFGVPSLKLVEDLKKICIKYGYIKSVKAVENYPDLENFTEVYHVHYQKLSSARYAKKKLDEKSFYGGILHVCYAPELESVEETRVKLAQRKKEINFKLKNLKYTENYSCSKDFSS